MYTEHPLLSPIVACTWEQTTATALEQRVVPDACVDLIWSGERLTIAGPNTARPALSFAPGTRIFAVRLRPGTAGAVFGLPATELRDEAPSAADVLGDGAAEALLDAPGRRRSPRDPPARDHPRRAVRPRSPRARRGGRARSSSRASLLGGLRARAERAPASAPGGRRHRLRPQDARAGAPLPQAPGAARRRR